MEPDLVDLVVMLNGGRSFVLTSIERETASEEIKTWYEAKKDAKDRKGDLVGVGCAKRDYLYQSAWDICQVIGMYIQERIKE